jgi:hypothetical protein
MLAEHKIFMATSFKSWVASMVLKDSTLESLTPSVHALLVSEANPTLRVKPTRRLEFPHPQKVPELVPLSRSRLVVSWLSPGTWKTRASTRKKCAGVNYTGLAKCSRLIDFSCVLIFYLLAVKEFLGIVFNYIHFHIYVVRNILYAQDPLESRLMRWNRKSPQWNPLWNLPNIA